MLEEKLKNYEGYSLEDLNLLKSNLDASQFDLRQQIKDLRGEIILEKNNISSAADENERNNILAKINLFKSDLSDLYKKDTEYREEIEKISLKVNQLNNTQNKTPDILKNTLDLEIWEKCKDIEHFLKNSKKISTELKFHLENTIWISIQDYTKNDDYIRWIDNLYKNYLKESDSELKNKFLSQINFLSEIIENWDIIEKIRFTRNKIKKVFKNSLKFVSDTTWKVIWSDIFVSWVKKWYNIGKWWFLPYTLYRWWKTTLGWLKKVPQWGKNILELTNQVWLWLTEWIVWTVWADKLSKSIWTIRGKISWLLWF